MTQKDIIKTPDISDDEGEMNSDFETALDELESIFEDMGITFYQNHGCCMSCGHAEATADNYVFYHGQDYARILNGDRTVYLAHNLDDEHKKKLLNFIANDPHDRVRWDGNDAKRILVSIE